jgi:hypothetical protein
MPVFTNATNVWNGDSLVFLIVNSNTAFYE